MNAATWQRAKSLLADAADLPAGDRERFVVERCPDLELRREVLELLVSPAPLSDIIVSGTLQPGTRLGPYVIEDLIGAGGMGEVYRARDTRLERTVAIKVLAAALADDPQFHERFHREARTISQLDHPHICVLYDFGEEDGTSYLVMQYLEGETLADRLQRGALPFDQTLRYGMQIADALEKAHSHGITHRDIKPANIFITGRGDAVVLDFGLARRTTPADTDAAAEGHVTEPGSAVGTIAYMSPEQAHGQIVDPRSDLWSLGVVLYEMVTGSRPFDGPTAPLIVDALLNQAPQAVRERNPTVPAALERIIGVLLEKDRGSRYASAERLREDLARAQTQLKPALRRRMRNDLLSYGIAAAVVLVLGGVAIYWQERTVTKPLTDRDVLVLADFTNATGDPVFDGTLRQGLAIQLAQSTFLKVMDDEQVQQDLRLMSLAPGERITNQIAHDICVRDAATATIGGSIANLGQDYVITLQAVNCPTGQTLAREQIQARDKEHVLNAVGTAAMAMRAKLGESRSSIQRVSQPLEQATTSSLEALQNFTAAQADLLQGRFLAAIPLLERATSLDPDFAMAHYFLSLASYNAGDLGPTCEHTSRAFALVDRVSENERDHITGSYYYDCIGELNKAIDAFRLGTRNYPRDWGFFAELGTTYMDLGQFEDGLAAAREGIRVQPLAEPAYLHQLDAYMRLDRLDEAKTLMEQARERGLDSPRLRQRELEIALIADDSAAADAAMQRAAGKPEEYFSFGLQARRADALGQRHQARTLYRQAAETALRRSLSSVATSFQAADTLADALVGNCQTVRRTGHQPLALALCGDHARAEKIASVTAGRFPNGTLWNLVQRPVIRAAMELQFDRPAGAVELLAPALPFERAYTEVPYLRGLAFLRLGKGREAKAEFEKILNHKGANWGPYYSLSYLGLARGVSLTGNTDTARKAFRDFFAAWKAADPDVSILLEARHEYAKLH